MLTAYEHGNEGLAALALLASLPFGLALVWGLFGFPYPTWILPKHLRPIRRKHLQQKTRGL